MSKVVINRCYGGFSVSEAVYKQLNMKWDGYGYIHHDLLPRDDPRLVEAVEALGDAANGSSAKLLIVNVPDGVAWDIAEYDGIEWIAEKHQTWP